MNKMLIIAASLIMVLMFVNIVFAEEDSVTFNSTENKTNNSYTINVNIQITGNDSTLRQDVYGTGKDKILDGGSEDNQTKLREICYNPGLQAYFNGIGNIPPADFVNYLKDLGYGDETHISFIWNLCQQEYINQHQSQWSQDQVGGGFMQEDIVSIFRDVVGFLNGNGNTVFSKSRDLAMILSSYFASNKDVWTLNNKINQQDLRIQTLERTMETIASEAYCQAKQDVMNEYNLTGVRCGKNSTIYWNAKKAGFDNYNTIAYSDCSEDWICTKWSDCTDGTRTRTCVDKNDCGSFLNKPAESQTCEVSSQQTTMPQSIASTPKSTASKVETFVPFEQVLLDNYMSILFIALISIPATLIVIGIKKDLSLKGRKR